jgi:ribA/ribD-fused uncharacterized protein
MIIGASNSNEPLNTFVECPICKGAGNMTVDEWNAHAALASTPLSQPRAEVIGDIEVVTIPKPALDWLMGEGLDPGGLAFGEFPDDHPKPPGAFWWRKTFREIWLYYAPRMIKAALSSTSGAREEHHKLDNDRQVFFYEQDFYVLSNFSSFEVEIDGVRYPTSEHAYHVAKFRRVEGAGVAVADVQFAPSAHEAFKRAQGWKSLQRPDWNEVRLDIMRDILRAKADQHEYVRRKLLATGDRELIEDSWRDDFWGWGSNCDGKNMLGKLWMEVRAELRIAPTQKGGE